MSNKTMREVDAHLEALIEAQHEKLLAATTDQERRDAWYSMRSLIASRSPFQVRRMELERGLR